MDLIIIDPESAINIIPSVINWGLILLVTLPLIILQIGLMIFALIHCLKHDKYKIGNRLIWIIVIVFVNIIGPILYFTIGRGEE